MSKTKKPKLKKVVISIKGITPLVITNHKFYLRNVNS